jgi:hypothetical protein
MQSAIEAAIKLLAEKITTDVKADDALKYTQAALNLAHVLQIKKQIGEADELPCTTPSTPAASVSGERAAWPIPAQRIV